MKARSKIALWTASFTLIVAMLFSGFVFFEMKEQPIRLVDGELEEVGELLAQIVNRTDQFPEISANILDRHLFERYWIRIGNEQVTLFESATSTLIKIEPLLLM